MKSQQFEKDPSGANFTYFSGSRINTDDSNGRELNLTNSRAGMKCLFAWDWQDFKLRFYCSYAWLDDKLHCLIILLF